MTIPIEAINPWIGAAFSVIGSVLDEEPAKGPLAILAQPYTACQVTVLVRVSGELSGVVMFGMGLVAADRLASVLLIQHVKSFDQVAANALAGLVHRVSREAHRELSQAGIQCEFSSPAIMKGSRVEIHDLALPAVVVPLTTSIGEIFLTVGLRQSAATRAA